MSIYPLLRCPPMRLRNSLLGLLGLGLLGMGLLATAAQAEGEDRAELALMGTVPIYWGEAAGFDELLSGEVPPHWARAVLEEQFVLVPLDYLSQDSLKDRRFLLMAQPRGLSAQENVALDTWVRSGGELLLFADPMMTGESRFHPGDRRRPQDVALLSPILARWGLELVFDAAQPEGLRTVDHFGDALPVNLRGRLRQDGSSQACVLSAEGLLAHCVIEGGAALIVADAAMIDTGGPYPGSEPALRRLLSHIYTQFGENAGNSRTDADDVAQNRVIGTVFEEIPSHEHEHGGVPPP